MVFPESVLSCIDALECRGFQAWAVGGCVRDWLLGIEPHDFDLCTDASPEQMQEVFSGDSLVLAGLKHGTLGVVRDGEVVEITTFRTEGNYADGRHPDWVRFVTDIRRDLARRDFTDNAMAYSPARGLMDPFGGADDLKNGVLRCVGEPEQRFREDALRILRGARFAARFRFAVEENTWQAMLSQAHLMEHLARERVFEELSRLLPAVDAEHLCRLGPVLARVIPELEPMLGFQQHSPHHRHEVFTHTAWVVQRVPEDVTMRFAALLHDVGKPVCFTRDANGRGHFKGHDKLGAAMADEILARLRAPTRLREEAVWLISHHMLRFPAEAKSVRRQLSRYGKERLLALLALQRADLLGKDAEPIDKELSHLDEIKALIESLTEREGVITARTLALTGRDLMALGYAPGPGMGRLLEQLREAVLDEKVKNDREDLLNFISCHKFD